MKPVTKPNPPIDAFEQMARNTKMNMRFAGGPNGNDPKTIIGNALVAVSPDGLVRLRIDSGFDHGLVNGEYYKVTFERPLR